MSKKGFERHNRKFQAKQQVASKFTQKCSKRGWFGWMDSDIKSSEAVEKLINKVVR